VETEIKVAEITRYETLPKFLKVIFPTFSAIGIAIAFSYHFGYTVGKVFLSEFAFYYLLFACFFTFTFLLLPGSKKDKKVPLYDIVFAALIFGISIYFFLNADSILAGSDWVPAKPFNLLLGSIFLFLLWEAARRMAGGVYAGLCVIVGFYPLYADYMPGPLYGMSFPLDFTISLINFSTVGVLGIPSRVIVILFGFLIFAGVLIGSGAGVFFLNLAFALLGRFRGGPAKVAVIASCFFGSLSGSIFSNVVATGSVTIPAMKRLGYPPYYAGAIEACASTGGVLMPPVMGAVAFVMCVILGVEYAVVIAAAFIPAILYYFGLLMQVDFYAAKVGLRGLPADKIPSLKKTLKDGWPFVTVLVFLVWGLLFMRWETRAPFYASGLMVLLSFTTRANRMTPQRMVSVLLVTGKLIVETFAILLPLGCIMAGLIGTGVASSATASLVALGGENLYLVLLLGVVACYLMGMVGMIVPAYLFLAVTLAPALVKIGGLNSLAVHLFIIYYAMLAAITPPVAPGSFIAASIAESSPMRTALQSMRLGVVIYIIPFFFLFNPALILQGPSLFESFYSIALCLLGITIIAAGMEGYLVRVGKVPLIMRGPLVLAGVLITFPEWKTDVIGAILGFFTTAIIWKLNKRAIEKQLE